MRRSEKITWGAAIAALLAAHIYIGIHIARHILNHFPEAGRAVIQFQQAITQLFQKP